MHVIDRSLWVNQGHIGPLTGRIHDGPANAQFSPDDLPSLCINGATPQALVCIIVVWGRHAPSRLGGSNNRRRHVHCAQFNFCDPRLVVGMRQESNRVGIVIDLEKLYVDGNVAYLSGSGVIIFDRQITIHYVKWIAVTSSGTHLNLSLILL